MSGTSLSGPFSLPAYPYDGPAVGLALGARLANQAVVESVGATHALTALTLLQIASAKQLIGSLVPVGPLQDAATTALSTQGAFVGLLQQQAYDWGRRFGHKAFSFCY
jgi:hypothetical protein